MIKPYSLSVKFFHGYPGKACKTKNKPLLGVPLCLRALVAIFIPGEKTKKNLLSSQKYGIYILQIVENRMGL